MQTRYKLNTFTLLLMISFASANAVLYSPALPSIARYFEVSSNTTQLTMTWFLIGYTLGQLIYGPLANRFGRKPALYAGIFLQIISSLICVLAGTLHEFSILVIGRFLSALGSGVGLKMAFTLINECYGPKIANQKTAYIMLAFGVMPGLSIAIGGFFTTHFGWTSCFYASAIYGAILLLLTTRLPETKKVLDLDALKLNHLIPEYCLQFKNPTLITSGFLMGLCTCFVYIFSTIGPFIAINLFGINSSQYGIANLLPPLGLIFGCLCAAYLAKKYASDFIIRLGIIIICAGSLLMLTTIILHLPVITGLFLPLIIVYFGLSLIQPNASILAMNSVTDKAHGSAVMSFINMGTATIVVLNLNLFSISKLLLPTIYLITCLILIAAYKRIALRSIF